MLVWSNRFIGVEFFLMMLCCLPDDIFKYICSYIESTRSDYPAPIHSSTTSLLLPLKFTCKSLLFDNSILSSNIDPPLFHSLFKFSLFFGHLDLLKWYDSFIGQSKKQHVGSDACSNAAENGRLEVLQYLHENGCPWNQSTCSNAAENGHLEVLKYLHENGCPCDFEAYVQSCLFIAVSNMKTNLQIFRYLIRRIINFCSK